MSGNPERTPASGPIPSELVDAFFDRELDEGSRETFFGMLRGDLGRCAEVARTQRMISMLREPVQGPDQTDRIMARVARKRGFMPERVRRMVTVGRLLAAVFVLAAVLGLAVVRRLSPDAFRLMPAPRPLSGVIESGRADAASGVQHMAAAVGAIQAPALPVAPTARGRAWLLSPGKVAVKTLAHATGAPLALPLGAGAEERFVFVDGVCIDRHTQATVALGAGPLKLDGAPCPEAIEQFIARVVQSMGAPSSGPSAAGRNSVE